MTDQRFPAINLTGRPSAVASVPGLSTNFAGVATIASGTAAVTVTGVEIGSDTAVFLGSMTHSYTAVTSGFTSRARFQHHHNGRVGGQLCRCCPGALPDLEHSLGA
jgi:hypothetical protein